MEHPVGGLIADTTTTDDFVVGDFDFDLEGLVLVSEREGLSVICIAFGISRQTKTKIWIVTKKDEGYL